VCQSLHSRHAPRISTDWCSPRPHDAHRDTVHDIIAWIYHQRIADLQASDRFDLRSKIPTQRNLGHADFAFSDNGYLRPVSPNDERARRNEHWRIGARRRELHLCNGEEWPTSRRSI